MTAWTRASFFKSALLAGIALSAIVATTALGHSNTIRVVAGTGVDGNLGDGGPAAQAELRSPQDVAPLLDGGYLVADYVDRVVRKVDKSGTIVRVAGTGASGSSGDGGPAVSAAVTPASVSPTSDGGFLIADRDNDRIRKVAKSGAITTIAGDGTRGLAGDGGPATTASLNSPSDALQLADGSILIADSGNGRVRRIATDGVISTVAAAIAPTDLAALPNGGYVFVDEGTAGVYEVDGAGLVERIAGSALSVGLGDGGLALNAAFTRPTGVAVLSDGSVLIADADAHRVRRIAPDGTIATAVGDGTAGSAGDGGDPAAAQLFSPHDIGVSAGGGYYVADAGNHAIRFIDGGQLPAVGPGGVDVVPPLPPLITASPSPLGTDATPSWSFTLREAGSTAWCRLKGKNGAVADWGSCTSPVAYDLSTQPDGEYRFDVKAKDAAGNSSSALTSYYVLDRQGPAAPVITASPPDHGSDERPAWSFALEPAATAQCRLERGDAVLSDWTDCTSPVSFDLSERKNGKYRFFVRAVDALGTAGAAQHDEYQLTRSLGKVPEVGRNQLPPGSPKPDLGRSVSVVPAAGVVRVKLPGARRYVDLEDAAALPVGTIFDARHGEVALSTALDREGNTQTGLFRGGKFDARQHRRGGGRTHLYLRGGDFSGCARPGTAEASIARKGGRRRGAIRSVWGKDKGGRYTTHGRSGAATVRGTEWLTRDRCDGTRIKVREGAVKVHDHAKQRSVLVRAGRSYFARARR